MSSKSTCKNMMSRTKWCWPHGMVYQEALASEGERRNGMFVRANYCLAALESLLNKQGRNSSWGPDRKYRVEDALFLGCGQEGPGYLSPAPVLRGYSRRGPG